MQYLVVLEKGDCSFGAYVPDLPGCITVGESEFEAMELIREAVEFHLEELKANGKPVPEVHSSIRFVEV